MADKTEGFFAQGVRGIIFVLENLLAATPGLLDFEEVDEIAADLQGIIARERVWRTTGEPPRYPESHSWPVARA